MPDLGDTFSLHRRRISALEGMALIAAYVVAGKLSLLLALPPGYASAIFPPAGIAVAAVLIAGAPALAWVFAGSLLLNVWIGYSYVHALSATVAASALAIALASTLQGFVGGFALRRLLGYPTGFDRARELVAFVFLTPAFCVTSASISVTVLTALGSLAGGDIATNWFTWWVGDSLGVLVILPVALATAGEPRSIWRGRIATVALPMLGTLALVIFGYISATRWELDESMRDFQGQSQSLYRQLQTRFEEQELLLREMAAFFPSAGSVPISRREFRRLAEGTLVHFPMVRAIEWVPRIEDKARDAFERQQRLELGDFAIRELSASGGFQAVAQRRYYYPVTFAEPMQRNRPVIGFDLNSSPERRSAVEQALASALPVASAPLHLVQDVDGRLGTLLMLHAQNGRQDDGVIVIALRSGDLIESTFPEDHSAYQVCMKDAAAQTALFGDAVCKETNPEFVRTIHFGGRKLLLETQPSSSYLAHHRGWGSWTALAVALFGTGILGAFLLLSAGARYRREQEERLAYSLIGSDLAMTDWSAVTDRVLYGEGWANILGYAPGELPTHGRGMLSFLHPDDLPRARAQFVAHLKGQTEMLESEFRMRHRDGRWVWVLARGMAVARDGRGRALRVTGTAKDITERHLLQEKVLADSTEIADLYEHAPCGYHSLSSAGVFLRINQTELEWLGRSRSEVIGKLTLADVLTPEGKARFGVLFPRFKETGEISGAEFDLVHRDGSMRRVSVSASAVRDADGSFRMSRSVMYDISELTKVRSALQRLALEQDVMLDNDLIGIIKLRDRKAVWANRAMNRIFGYAPGELLGKSSRVLYPDDAAFADIGEAAYPMLARGETFRRQAAMVRKDGEPVWIDASGVALPGGTGESMWMMLDVTTLRRQQEKIEHLAFHDVLTDLPNRLLLTDRLKRAIAAAERSASKLAVCYLDLDGFKPINDRYGHEAGDALLRELAARLQSCVRVNDSVCRIGGDEFVPLIADLADEQEFERVMQRVLVEINRPFRLSDTTDVGVSASIGAALYPDDATARETLLRLADMAMYRAKKQGRNQVVRYGSAI